MTEPQQTTTDEEAPREPITEARVRELFEDAQYEPRDYTGRGMRGDARCLAVVTDEGREDVTVILDVIQACAENGTAEDVVELVNLLRGSRTESLGRGIVIYWPDIAWSDCAAEEEDDNPDDPEHAHLPLRGDREDFHSDG